MRAIHLAATVAVALGALGVGCDRGHVSQYGTDASYGPMPGADAGPGVPNPMPGSPIADAGAPTPTILPPPTAPGAPPPGPYPY
jgi:hypothetical protein